MIANSDIIAKIYLRMDLYMVTDHHILADIGKSTYEHFISDSSGFCPIGGLLYAMQLLRFYFLVPGE